MNKRAFISWSGTSARPRAVALKGLLGDILPEASIFMSDRDIPAGSLWLDEVTRALDDSVAGVIIVTPENLSSTWLHFEAGALATRVEKRMVIPVLCELSTDALMTSPLASFQALAMSEENIKQVCASFADALEIPRSEAALNRMFEKWWPDYMDILMSPEKPAPTKHQPTIEDLHQGILALQSFAKSQSEAISQLLNRVDVAPAIMGQGPLATASPAEGVDLLKRELLTKVRDEDLAKWLSISLKGQSQTFDKKQTAELLERLRKRQSDDRESKPKKGSGDDEER